MSAFSFPNQPLIGADLKTYWSIIKDNNYNIDKKFLRRSLYVGSINHSFTSFFSELEKMLSKKQIDQVELKKDPIFIIGHWRTGTTFLHYLMCKDPQWGFISNAQSFFPNYMFHNNNPIINTLIGLHLPKKRPMDNVLMDLDLPQEEEFALGNISKHSCYHWWTFPGKMKQYFTKYALLENLTKKEYKEFREAYLFLMKKVSLINSNKNLLIKNPVNTGRIPFLLELFPNAKFIYLERNPIEVYHSTLKLHIKLLEKFSFQKYDKREIEINTLKFYKTLTRKYQKDKLLIPNQNLLELTYESMLANPLLIVNDIYSKLKVKLSEDVKIKFQCFVDSQKNFKCDSYNIEKGFQKKLQSFLLDTSFENAAFVTN